MVSIYTLYVVNKSGGLIYSRDFTSVAKVDLNDALRLASIWHSMHAISSQLSPVPGCTGVELLEADTFTLHCFQTLTGTKFLLVVEPNTPYVPALLRRIYEVYSDYVLKNPFYEVEQDLKSALDSRLQNLQAGSMKVIKCELFDEHLELAVRRHNV